MPRFPAAHILATVLCYPVVPVFYHADAAYAQHILSACYAGGLRAFEFTNRGDNALEVFSQLAQFARQTCPDLLLGIGTIYTALEAQQFIRAGADFVVQPCLTTEVGAVCRQHDTPWLPGAMTVLEVYQATQLGAALVKLFPGNVLGPGFVRSLRGPLPHVKLMVTGGVEPKPACLREWFEAGVDVVGLGTQLFSSAPDPEALKLLLHQLLMSCPNPRIN